jgi:serine-type D-Ala-D-Ala carboxypeptidase/endopeptidase
LTAEEIRHLVELKTAPFVNARNNMGLAVGVVDGNNRHHFGFGRHSIDGPEIDDRTLFEIGSITKVFTAILLADMHLRGRVDINDPVNRYLPREGRISDRDDSPVTLRHLATHSSGLPRLPRNMKLWKIDVSNPYATYTVADLYAANASGPPKRAPGVSTAYSNYGMGLLGHVLSLAASMDYEQLVIERICRPLGMRDTIITLNEEQRTRLAKGHQSGKPVPNWDLPTLAGAGALRSTVRDLTRFMAAALHATDTPIADAMALAQSEQTCARPFYPPRELLAAGVGFGTYKLMNFADVSWPRLVTLGITFAAMIGTWRAWPPNLSHMGLGWHFADAQEGKPRVLWHNGGTGGYRSYLALMPDSRKGVVLLANSNASPDGRGGRLLKALAKPH